MYVPTDTEGIGVVTHKEKKCDNGLILWNSRSKSIVNLMDRKGNIVQKWNTGNQPVHYSELHKDFLYVIAKDEYFRKIDPDSKIIWNIPIRGHHDMSFYNGKIYLLTRKGDRIDHVTVICLESGKILNTYCINNIISKYFEDVDFSVYDTLHTNSIQAIDDETVLLSFRNISIIAIVNLEEEKILWFWGKDIVSRQHHATMLDNGNILLFDNGVTKKRSRVLEINIEGKILWESNVDFYSRAGSSCQILPNNHVLICSNEDGRIFEITRENEVVWDFLNPDMKGNKRGAIYRAMRVEK
jgi:hypothetical protein